MRSIDPSDPGASIRFAGVLHRIPGPDGVVLSRLSAAAHHQVVDPVLLWTAGLPSGARLELVSDTSSIEVELLITRLAYGDDSPRPAMVDLVVDGELVAGAPADGGHTLRFPSRTTMDFQLEPGAPATVRFDGLAAGEKHLQVWLPANASVALREVRVDDGASVAPASSTGRRWVHYGSSISHCTEADRPTGVWPVIVARRAGIDLQSLAIAGQAHLDQFAARTIRDLDVDLISLKVGINVVNGDTLRERTFVPAVHGFLDTIRDGHPDTPILLVSPIVCPVVEDHPGPTASDAAGMCRALEPPPGDLPGALTLRRIRTLLAEVVASRVADGDGNLTYLDGLDLFGPDDVNLLPDGLHPNPEGYARMADRFYERALDSDGPFSA
jgi:hypothetical protein